MLTQPIFSNIRFWIILFFLVRLYGITNPPLEVAHNWRQTTVTMVARNFLEVDNNILYPRVDFAGDLKGITGMEFPVLNYGIYLTSKVFGYQHWYGRLINLIISSIGLLYFFLLIAKYFNEKLAFRASIILLFSIWFSFSRKIMPDTFSMSFIMAALYYGSHFLDRELKWKNLIFYFLLVLIGVLAKLPSAYLLVLFALPIFKKSIAIQRKIWFVLATVLAVIPAVWWYFNWVPHLVEEFGFWHFFMGKSLSQGLLELAEHWPLTFSRFYETALKFVGFGFFALGLFRAIKLKQKKLLWILGLSFGAFFVIMAKAGFTFSHHSYYIIPFAPIMALIAAYGIGFIKNQNLAIVALLAIGLEGLANQFPDFRIKENYAAIENLEAEMDQFSNRNDLILINSGKYPTAMYFSHRKGWIASNEEIKQPGYLETLKGKGLKYAVILKHCFGTEINLEYELILDNEHWKIYKL